jgi:hypothetical protein
LPAIGISISFWPAAAFRGFLTGFFGALVSTAAPPIRFPRLARETRLPEDGGARAEFSGTYGDAERRRIVIHSRPGISDVVADAGGVMIEAECKGGAIETTFARKEEG